MGREAKRLLLPTSQRAMKAIGAKTHASSDIWELIRVLNRVLRWWGGYLRTSNASDRFNPIDRYERERPVRLLSQRRGDRRWKPGGRPFRCSAWPHRRFVAEYGLCPLLGTIRYPGGVNAA